VEQKGFHRKFITILHDAATGYSRLNQDGRAATVKILDVYNQLISELIKTLFPSPQILKELPERFVIPMRSKYNNYYSSK
jgi:hypothetical protein